MKYHPKITQAYHLIHEGTLALSQIEYNGIRVDLEKIQGYQLRLQRRIDNLENQLKQTNFYKRWNHITKNINLNSNPQLAHYLFDVLKLKTERLTESGQYSTDEESLKALNIPELNLILEIRKWRKVKDTYLDGFKREQSHGYLHPSFNLHLVRTYRSSSDSPNFQNIPRHDEEAMKICRQVILPHPDHLLLEIDFKGIEVVIGCCYHRDTNMIQYLKDPSSDMHADLTKEIFLLERFDKSIPSHNILRMATKNSFVFPQFYGDYYKNCARNLCEWVKLPMDKWKLGMGLKMDESFAISDHLIAKGINSYDSFTNHIQALENKFWTQYFANYAQWKERWWETYQKYGYIDLLTGFRCGGVMGRNDCINYPIQGTAFHCLLWSLIQINKLLLKKRLRSKIIGQIHDSILFSVAPDELELICAMSEEICTKSLAKTWRWIIVPLAIEYEKTEVNCAWSEKEKYVPFKS